MSQIAYNFNTFSQLNNSPKLACDLAVMKNLDTIKCPKVSMYGFQMSGIQMVTLVY